MAIKNEQYCPSQGCILKTYNTLRLCSLKKNILMPTAAELHSHIKKYAISGYSEDFEMINDDGRVVNACISREGNVLIKIPKAAYKTGKNNE